jgi:hypothetical protein
MDDDLHGGVVVIDQGVEAFVHQVLKRDPPGDEGVACEKSEISDVKVLPAVVVACIFRV